MANHATTSKLLDQTVSVGSATSPGLDDPNEVEDEPKVLTNPNAIVDGQTIIQWSEQWLKVVINTPAGPVNGFNDPNGTVAAAINSPNAKMYFITGDPASDTRTFNVHHGQDVFLPIVGVTDSEGPGIAPTIQGPGAPDFGAPGQPGFADGSVRCWPPRSSRTSR
jgi:hypothetical protein